MFLQNERKAGSAGNAHDTLAFWNVLPEPAQARVRDAGFMDFISGLRSSTPHFSRRWRYALLERWNDVTKSFHFGFGEMTITPADFTALSGLGFEGEHPPMDTRYRAICYVLCDELLGLEDVDDGREIFYDQVRVKWMDIIRERTETWQRQSTDAAPTFSQLEMDQLARAFIFYLISTTLLLDSRNRGDPAVLVALADLRAIRDQDWASVALAHLYHGLDAWVRGSHDSSWVYTRWLEVCCSIPASFAISSQYARSDILTRCCLADVGARVRFDPWPTG